jgi:hypothetical protein
MKKPLDYSGSESPGRRAGSGWHPRRVGVVLSVVVLTGAVAIIPFCFNREGPSLTPSASRLHQIGLGILLYQADHAGRYPDSLDRLVDTEKMKPEVILCPAKNRLQIPYVYLGWPRPDDPDATMIVAYTPLAYHDGEGVDALYGDGHGEWLWPADLQRDLAKRQAELLSPTTVDASTRPATVRP